VTGNLETGPNLVDAAALLPPGPLAGAEPDENVIGAEIPAGVVERRERRFVTDATLRRDAEVLHMAENDVQALVGLMPSTIGV
jgi:hypothetical protein